jgi:hypothetical protein
MTNDDLTRLREKLAWLRALDRGGEASSPSSLASFGASRHLHLLAPPIASEDGARALAAAPTDAVRDLLRRRLREPRASR